MIQAEKMIMMSKKQYTLTISTNPTSATCTLTYNGNSYSSKTCTVDQGTVVSYSIYHSTYGTETGSITMDSDKTINFEGTYSTSTTYTSWTRPNLSANGTLGGSSFACYPSSEYGTNYKGWKAFDGDTTASKYWQTASGIEAQNNYIIWYNPDPIKISKLSMYNRNYGSFSATSGYIYGSNTNGNWTQLKYWTSSVHGAGSNPWTITINSTTGYKYHKLQCYTIYNSNYSTEKPTNKTTVCFAEIGITATKETTAYNYYWNISTN